MPQMYAGCKEKKLFLRYDWCEGGYILNAFERMNEAIDYLENNITGEINYAKAAEIAGCSKNQFQRMFSYLTDTAITEYIRRRRLTLSAFELLHTKLKVIDIALKYGYDSHASFARAFREFHGIAPSEARQKGIVFHIYPKLTFQTQNLMKERSGSKMAVLGMLELIELPAVRMIGIPVTNGGGDNPVPALWEKCFKEKTLEVLEQGSPVVDYYIGWMGEFNLVNETFTYIAGMLMPAGTRVPEGFDFREIKPCLVSNGYINGSFENGDVFSHSHELTVGGMTEQGYEPDYSQGWSAEAYDRDLSFDAEEGTINYFCPCKKV